MAVCPYGAGEPEFDLNGSSLVAETGTA